MGGNDSKAAIKEGSHEHSKFGQVQLEKEMIQVDPPEENYELSMMNVTMPIDSQRVWQDWVASLKKVDDTETRDTLLLPEKYEFNSVGMCGFSGLAKLKFEYYEYLLDCEILNRKPEDSETRYFKRAEMWYIIYVMVRAANKMELIKQKIGNVHPNNILINELGQIKLICTSSFPSELDNFTKKIQKPDEKVFLAPQQIVPELIAKGQYPTNVDPCRAEMFSIGLTLLSCGILNVCDDLYQQKPFRIMSQQIPSLLASFGKIYSPLMTKLIASLLVINPHDRASGSSIYNTLFPFEDSILDFLPIQNDPEPEPQRQSIRGGPVINANDPSYKRADHSGQPSGVPSNFPARSSATSYANYQAPFNPVHLPNSQLSSQPSNQPPVYAPNKMQPVYNVPYGQPMHAQPQQMRQNVQPPYQSPYQPPYQPSYQPQPIQHRNYN